jgi:two-component system response regulator AtoC
LDEVLFTVKRALTQQSLIAQVRSLSSPQVRQVQSPTDRFLGRTPAMLQVFKTIGRLAKTSESVLILGESGTGKELVATAIHESSSRAGRPFIKVNCAALSSTLLESELFGHERGAFTGAVSQRIGRFEQAEGGTIFLDEIGDLDIDLQAKLLRILQTGQFERVGGNQIIACDVRVISATNHDIAAMVEGKRFREDLLYRLNVVTINLPALRERSEDIALLAEHFVRELAQKYAWPNLALDPQAVQWLEKQAWPGNVRQLQNVLARGATLARGQLILRDDLQSSTATPEENAGVAPKTPTSPLLLKEVLADTESRIIAEALDQTNWNRTEAARALGISRRQLFDKIRQYDLKEFGR